MKRLLILAIVLSCASSCYAQLTHDQKVSDFSAIAGLYDKNYGPYNWKIEAFGYDMLRLQPWLAQINASTDDLSFYDICVRSLPACTTFMTSSFFHPSTKRFCRSL